MRNLYLLCGKPGCGKTTLAIEMKRKYKMIHLSADHFMLNLFGEIQERDIFEQKLNACKEIIYEISKQLLESNNDVVLDFGFWTKNERNYVKNLFAEYNVVLIYLDLNNEKIFEQITKRNNNLQSNEYYIDRETFEFLSSKFEEPTIDEVPIVVKDVYSFIKSIESKK